MVLRNSRSRTSASLAAAVALVVALAGAGPAVGAVPLSLQDGKVKVGPHPTRLDIDIVTTSFCRFVLGDFTCFNGYTISSSEAFTFTGSGCTEVTDSGARQFRCAPGPTSTEVIGSPANDSITQTGGIRPILLGGRYSPALTVSGGDGDDVITGGNGADALAGEGGNDTIRAGGGTDTVTGSTGTDDLDGESGEDTVSGADGGDAVQGGTGNDAVDGGQGDDTVSGGAGVDTLAGGQGDDAMSGGSEDDAIDGGDGVDSIAGGAGADDLSGGGGGDILTGGEDNDALVGGEGRDRVTGGGGDDTLDGGGDGDSLEGGPGGDALLGGDRRDLLIGGEGADAIAGGADLDTVSYEDRSSGVSVTLDGAGNDGAPGEADAIAADVENVIGGGGEDTIVGSAAANDLDAGAGGDVVDAGGGADFVDAGPGNDAVVSREGVPDSVECADGVDQVTSDEFDTVTACETVLASREFQADVDNDGIPAPADCDDRDARRRPGLPDRPGNRVDEDCSGADAAFTRVFSPIQTSFATSRGRTRVVRLNVLEVPPGATVELRCAGGRRLGCFSGVKRTRHPKGAARVTLARHFKGRLLRRRARIEVRILDEDQIGKVVRYTAQAGSRIPRSTLLCLPPGTPRPGRC